MKRLVAAPLWFLVGWYIGAATAWILGLSPVIAPILGFALASLIVVDPRHIIWDRPAIDEPMAVSQTNPSADPHSV